MTYFYQHYLVKLSPSLVIGISSSPSPAKGGLGTPELRSTAVCCFYVNNSIAHRFYYHTQYVHGGEQEFHRQVKKTTSSLENRVSEIENRKH